MFSIFTPRSAKADAIVNDASQTVHVECASAAPDTATAKLPCAEIDEKGTENSTPVAASTPASPPPVSPVSADEITALTESVATLAGRVDESGKCLKSLGDRIALTEATYKQLLAEDQVSIRDMVQQIRSLENRQYREEVLKPIVVDLVDLADALEQLKEFQTTSSGPSCQQNIEWIDAMGASLSATMKRCNLVRMSRDVSTVDTRYQKVVRIERVPPRKDGEIVSVDRDGYYWDGKVLRAQEVTVRQEG